MDAIHIFNMVQRVIPSQLWIVGEGPDLEPAQQLAQKLGIRDSVKFKGRILKIEEILAEADLLLSTSEMESFGLTVAEAMSVEIPVVAYNVGGIPEVIGNSNAGALVPFGETCTAAEAVINILSNCEKAHRMGKSGRKYIVENFELDRIVHQYINIYSGILGIKLL
jgi:glycosyltransferase involved in cell wall biosynthesis